MQTARQYRNLGPKPTRLQIIQRKGDQFHVTKGDLTAKQHLRNELATASQAHFAKARDKALQMPWNPRSYFNRFEWEEKGSIEIKAPRRITSAYFVLKLGHGYLKSYLFRFGLLENDKCRCGSRETAEHLLLRCRMYAGERQKHIQQRTLKDLFTGEGRMEVLQFIEATGIATRTWHLARGDDEDQDEERGLYILS